MARGRFITFEGGEGCGKSTQVVRLAAALEAGTWVISDRFSDSTVAYQGYGRGLPVDFVRQANDFACEGLRPDLTFLLDLDPATAERRMRGREAATNTSADRIERAGSGFHARLRRGFLELAAADAPRFSVVDASKSPDEVAGVVLGECLARLKPGE